MTRIEFLKSLIVVVAAPKLIPQMAGKPRNIERTALYLKVAQEIWNPTYQIDLEQIIRDHMITYGLDPNKKFTIESGYDADDFKRNAISIVIKQDRIIKT